MTTITESPTEAAALSTDGDAPASALSSGLTGMLTTTDHKDVGSMYVRMALVFAAAITVVGAVAGLENIDRDSLDIFNAASAVNQLNWLYLTGLATLVVMPLLVGIGTAVVPLQVGSTSIAFPRASAGGFWTWLVGAGAYVGSFIVDGGFSSGINVDDRAVALTIAALGVTVAGLMLSMICIATTVIALRPAGMSLRRVPLLSWSMMIAAVTWLMSLAVLIADLVVEYVALQHTDRGVDAFEAIAWMLSGPQVFAFAIPVLGIAGDVIAGVGGQRQKLYDVILGGIAAVGLLSFGAFAQSKYDLGTRDVTDELTYILVGVVLLLPLLAVAGGLLDTFRLGRKDLKAVPLIGALAALLMLLAGAAANAVRVIGHWGIIDDWNETRIMDRGVMHYALLAGLIAGVAGLYYWAPKIFGRRFNQGLGGLAVLLLLAGTVVIALPDVIAGFLESNDDASDVLALISMIGGFIVAGGAFLALDAVAFGLIKKSDEVIEDNPWGANTLEWATTSPPPVGNFAAPVPLVMSETPLLDEHDDDAADAADAKVDA